MPQDKGRTFVSQSISFPPELLARAKQRAERVGLPFSTYVQKCVERDLMAREPIIFEERNPDALMVAEDASNRSKSASRNK